MIDIRSKLDGLPSVQLNYQNYNDIFWGSMRDEIRQVSPGLFLGLGSLGAFGGLPNSAICVLERQLPDKGVTH